MEKQRDFQRPSYNCGLCNTTSGETSIGAAVQECSDFINPHGVSALLYGYYNPLRLEHFDCQKQKIFKMKNSLFTAGKLTSNMKIAMVIHQGKKEEHQVFQGSDISNSFVFVLLYINLLFHIHTVGYSYCFPREKRESEFSVLSRDVFFFWIFF